MFAIGAHHRRFGFRRASLTLRGTSDKT